MNTAKENDIANASPGVGEDKDEEDTNDAAQSSDFDVAAKEKESRAIESQEERIYSIEYEDDTATFKAETEATVKDAENVYAAKENDIDNVIPGAGEDKDEEDTNDAAQSSELDVAVKVKESRVIDSQREGTAVAIQESYKLLRKMMKNPLIKV